MEDKKHLVEILKFVNVLMSIKSSKEMKIYRENMLMFVRYEEMEIMADNLSLDYLKWKYADVKI